jgi:hypothetical protein
MLILNNKYLLYIFFGLYFISMILYPLCESKGDWNYIQYTWYSWQSFNAGVLLFFSSIVGLKIATYNEKEERRRNLLKAKALLPDALSELSTYLESSGSFLKAVLIKTQEKDTKKPLENQPPDLPMNYKNIFANCIHFGEPDVADYLIFILGRLQVHNSRINSLSRNFDEVIPNKLFYNTIISYLYCFAELKTLIDKLYPYARGLEKLDTTNLVLNDYLNVYHHFDIWPDDYEGLKEATERFIQRNNKDIRN